VGEKIRIPLQRAYHPGKGIGLDCGSAIDRKGKRKCTPRWNERGGKLHGGVQLKGKKLFPCNRRLEHKFRALEGKFHKNTPAQRGGYSANAAHVKKKTESGVETEP